MRVSRILFEDDGGTEMAVLAEVIRDARTYNSTTDDDDVVIRFHFALHFESIVFKASRNWSRDSGP